MNDKWLAILDALDRLGGEAPLSDIRAEAGVSIKDANNSLRALEPDYVEVVRHLDPWEWDGGGDPPKVLRITEAGKEKAAEYSTPFETDRLHEVEEAVNDLAERDRRKDKKIADLRKEMKQLKKMILALDE